MSRRLYFPLAVSCLSVIGAAADIRLLAVYWPGNLYDGITSSVWTAIAWDAAHGELYRPLVDAAGYGGTRYMPIFPLLHSLLIRAHADVIYSAVALMQLSVVAAAIALFFALRSFEVPPVLAAPLAGTVWATVVYQKYATDARGDYLAAALAMTAVALVPHAGRGGARAVSSGLVAVAAAFTKITAAAVAAPIAVMLFVSGRGGRAIRFTSAFVVGGGAALLIVQAASHGHFLENLRATATGGGDWRYAIRAPWTLVDELAREPFVGVPVVLAAWSCLRRRRAWTLADAYFLTACAVTTVIFASPGTASNHLVDLQMAAGLVVGISVHRGDFRADAAAAVYATLAVVLVVVSWPVPGFPSVLWDLAAEGPRTRTTALQLHDAYVKAGRRYLSTDAIVPILHDERPIVLDAFSLRGFVVSDADAGRDLERRIEAREFEPIIIRENSGLARDIPPGDPALGAFRAWYWPWKHDPLADLFHTAYEVVEVRRPFVVLMPRR